MRCLYVDLDTTLLGAGGAVTRDGEGAFTLLGLRALEACHRAGVLVVAMSERATLAADARLLGLSDYVLGAGFAVDGEVHQAPEPVGKAAGVAAHGRARGLRREDCVAVSGAREDLQLADVVGTLWLVGNAAELGGHANVRVAEASHGPGVYEAVITTLAERR